MNLSHILNMGGYGLYVWSAYGITLGVFAMNVILFVQEKKRIKKLIKQSLSQCSLS